MVWSVGGHGERAGERTEEGHMRQRGGFTLIEILIVIVVIAILLGVLLPQFRGTQDEARMQRGRSELRTVATALESYFIHNQNAFPSALSGLITATPRIISSVPDDPFRGGSNDYTYYRDSGANPVYYVVFAYGPDGAAAISGISTAGVIACSGACATSIDDVCITNGTPVGATSGNC